MRSRGGRSDTCAPDNPRYRLWIDEPAEQAVLARLNAGAAEGLGITEMAARLSAEGGSAPRERLRLATLRQGP